MLDAGKWGKVQRSGGEKMKKEWVSVKYKGEGTGKVRRGIISVRRKVGGLGGGGGRGKKKNQLTHHQTARKRRRTGIN